MSKTLRTQMHCEPTPPFYKTGHQYTCATFCYNKNAYKTIIIKRSVGTRIKRVELDIGVEPTTKTSMMSATIMLKTDFTGQPFYYPNVAGSNTFRPLLVSLPLFSQEIAPAICNYLYATLSSIHIISFSSAPILIPNSLFTTTFFNIGVEQLGFDVIARIFKLVYNVTLLMRGEQRQTGCIKSVEQLRNFVTQLELYIRGCN